MKLRNKKTGEIGEIRYDKHSLYIDTDDGFIYWFATLANLNETWEDYISLESLIKDKEVYKAVKSWILTNYRKPLTIYFDKDMNGFYMQEFNSDRTCCGITFHPHIELGLEEREYSFKELCGEEE